LVTVHGQNTDSHANGLPSESAVLTHRQSRDVSSLRSCPMTPGLHAEPCYREPAVRDRHCQGLLYRPPNASSRTTLEAIHQPRVRPVVSATQVAGHFHADISGWCEKSRQGLVSPLLRSGKRHNDEVPNPCLSVRSATASEARGSPAVVGSLRVSGHPLYRPMVPVAVR